jgi:hypothetical protein
MFHFGIWNCILDKFYHSPRQKPVRTLSEKAHAETYHYARMHLYLFKDLIEQDLSG